MKSSTYKLINNLITVILYIVTALFPLLFLNLTTNYFDMPKLAFLFAVSLLLLGLWIISWIANGKIEVTRTPLDLPLLFVLLVVVASTIFSTSRYSSIYGTFPEIHGSAISWVTYILLYFVAASNLGNTERIKTFLQIFLGSALLVSLIGILSYLGLFLPFEIAKSLNFSPSGSTFSTNALLLLLLPLLLISISGKDKLLPQVLAAVLSFVFTAAIIFTGTLEIYAVLLMIYALSFYAARKELSNNSSLLFLTPFITGLVILALNYLPFNGNIFNNMRNNFPQEVQLPLGISWKISASAFRDAPFLGTGPATYLFNFTSYKPVDFNQLKFWNYSFSYAYNEILQILGTWGLLGITAIMTFCGILVINIKKYLFAKNNEDEKNNYLLSALSVSAIVAIALFFIHASTLVSIIATLFLMLAFMLMQKGVREKASELSLGVRVLSSGNSQIDFLPVFVFMAYLAGAFFVGRYGFKLILADYYHRQALNLANKDGAKTYDYLQKAENLNPFIDLYRVDMAQTNFALANGLASQKGPTKENPNGTLTDTDKQTIQTLVTQAINEGRVATTLSPRSSRNWEVLALIYKSITGVAKNSLTFSLDAYGRAIQLDPYNPTLRMNAGNIYYTSKNYEMAIRFYTDAVNLKPDYLNGYYNLALALEEKGDLQNAKIIAEKAVGIIQGEMGSHEFVNMPKELRDSKSNDLNTLNQLLSDINGKIESGSKTGEGEATGGSQPLQNPNLPSINVPDLNNPPQTTPPPAVEENPEVRIPQINPETTPTP